MISCPAAITSNLHHIMNMKNKIVIRLISSYSRWKPSWVESQLKPRELIRNLVSSSSTHLIHSHSAVTALFSLTYTLQPAALTCRFDETRYRHAISKPSTYSLQCTHMVIYNMVGMYYWCTSTLPGNELFHSFPKKCLC